MEVVHFNPFRYDSLIFFVGLLNQNQYQMVFEHVGTHRYRIQCSIDKNFQKKKI